MFRHQVVKASVLMPAVLLVVDVSTRPTQADLKALRRGGGAIGRAYQLKEAPRAVFAGDLATGDLATGDVMDLLERWCSRAQRSRIPDFVNAGATIRRNKDGITAAIESGLSNGRHEGLNLWQESHFSGPSVLVWKGMMTIQS